MEAPELPIRRYAKDILSAVKSNDVCVIIGETGSGKTTQISQILLEAGLADNGMIGVTQPRRVGAVTVAKRVAEERQCELGREVGYAVRFEDRSSRETKVKYLTDGTLLRECLEDETLSRYSVIALDEAHERSLNTDILFGVLKRLVQDRKGSLKLIITSATLEGEKFSLYFNQCPVFHVPGRCHPVDIIHAKEDHITSYLPAAIDTVLQVHCHQPAGDILLFLTGQQEIQNAVRRINEAVCVLPEGTAGELLVLPLYAALPPDMQLRVFRPGPPGMRRCIVATNVAETSVTVEGVVYVIDTGVVKQKNYNPSTGMDALEVTPISRVQATQRAGRAGRTRPGKCFRLYTQSFYDKKMPSITLPEIQRSSLVSAVLYLKSLRLAIDVLAFDFLDRPEPEALRDALRQLYVLDALDVDGEVTEVGRRMSALPLDASLSRALLAAWELGCVPEVISIAAMLSAEHVFSSNHGPESGNGLSSQGEGNKPGGRGGHHEPKEKLKALMEEGMGDHILLLRVWQAWQREGCSKGFCNEYGLELRGMNFARDIRRQLQDVAGEDGCRLDQPGTSGQGRQADRGERDQQASRRNEGDWRQGRLGPLDDDADGERSRKRPRTGSARSEPEILERVVHALTIGFANRLARRLRSANGYRTLSESGQLAQVHPATSTLTPDDDGLLPEWIIYHELVATSRPFLRQVCATKPEYVSPLLPKLTKVDVDRLSRGRLQLPVPANAGSSAPLDADSTRQEERRVAVPVKRNDDATVSAAKQRYLQRKAAASATGGKKK